MLWEALAGRHPFWRSSLLETAKAIEAGAPRLETMRPDLPRPLLAAVDRALDLDPARRPNAAALAGALRISGERRRRGSGRAFVMPASVLRVAPALAAALVAGWSAWAIPFYPRGWPFGLALLAAAGALWRPRVGLMFALAVPVLPLGNLALGAALLYAAVAALVLVLSWPEPRAGLLFCLGPVLAPLAALGLLPLTTTGIRSPVRRALQAGVAILTAGIVAGIRGASLPFDGSHAPVVRIAASDDPLMVAGALWSALLSRPALAVEAIVLAVVAAALPYARERGLWAVAGLGAGFLAAALLAVPTVAAAPLVVAVWATCLVLAVR
jgi:hypothetical protein